MWSNGAFGRPFGIEKAQLIHFRLEKPVFCELFIRTFILQKAREKIAAPRGNKISP